MLVASPCGIVIAMFIVPAGGVRTAGMNAPPVSTCHRTRLWPQEGFIFAYLWLVCRLRVILPVSIQIDIVQDFDVAGMDVPSGGGDDPCCDEVPAFCGRCYSSVRIVSFALGVELLRMA